MLKRLFINEIHLSRELTQPSISRYAYLASKLETDRVIRMADVGCIYTLDSKGTELINTFSPDMTSTL